MATCDLVSGRLFSECLSGRAGIKTLFFTKFNDFSALTGIVESGGEITSLGADPITIYRFEMGTRVGNFEQPVTSSKENGTAFVTHTITLSLFNILPADISIINALKRGRWAVWALDYEGKIRLFGRFVGCVSSSGSDVSGAAPGDKNGLNLILTAMENDKAPFMADYTTNPFDNFGNVTVTPSYTTPSPSSPTADSTTVTADDTTITVDSL